MEECFCHFSLKMLDLKKIRENPEEIQKAISRKGVSEGIIAEILVLDEKKRILQKSAEEMRALQNATSQKIPLLSGEEKTRILAEMKELSGQIKNANEALTKAESELQEKMESLPNPPEADVPDGGEDDFVVLREWGEKRNFDFAPREHFEIAEDLGILDTERSAKVSGSRFYFLRDELAILQMALMNWAFLEIQKMGFSPTIPPFMTRERAIYGTGYLARDENYVVNPGEDNLYLIGTSEVPLTSFYADEIIDEAILPAKFAGYSPCFRREAGSYGKDAKGILRVHQFEKIEMVAICAPEDSPRIHKEILAIEEKLLQMLGIPYRVVLVAAGDLGGSATKKYDCEAWLPGQGKYREMTSTSNCTDFQARRLNIRLRRKDGEVVIAHTLNGTAVSSRPLIAILENFQNMDGSVDIPEVLRPFAGGLEKITRK